MIRPDAVEAAKPKLDNISRDVSRFNLFESYKDIANDKENLSGHIEFVFTLRFANLFEEAILTNNLDCLSEDQLKIVKLYFIEADTGVLNNKNQQLDIYLGGL